MSHPSRVRGLKLDQDIGAVSHPSRVRGLKSTGSLARAGLLQFMSHPSRVRGLKCCCKGRERVYVRVAPFAGAWIEISTRSSPRSACSVAPFAGAWIEITLNQRLCRLESPVAPFAGAWIEICR